MKALHRTLFALLICLQLSQVVLYKLFYIAAILTCELTLTVVLCYPKSAAHLSSRVLHVLAVLGFFGLTTAWSLSPATTATESLYALIWIPVFVTAFVVFRTSTLADCASLLSIVPVFIAAVFGYAFLTYGSLRPEFAPQVASLCNLASMLLVGYLPLLVWRMYASGERRFRSLPAVLCLLLLLCSQSRTGMFLGVLTYVASILWLSEKPIKGFLKLLKGAALAGGVLALLYSNEFVSQQMDYAFRRFTAGDYSIAGFQSMGVSDRDGTRKRNIMAGIEACKEHWTLGIGYMAFADYTGMIYNEPVSQHSIYLALVGETGIMGTLLFFSLVWRFFSNSLRTARNHRDTDARLFGRALLMAMTAVLVFGLTGQVHQSIVFFNLLAWGLACPAPKRAAAIERPPAPAAGRYVPVGSVA